MDVRNPQSGIRRETVQNSRRFLVAALLGMTMGRKLLGMTMSVFGFFTTLSFTSEERSGFFFFIGP